MSDVTQILKAIEIGNRHAADELLPLVYEELRKLAAAKMVQESPGQTLQATALVHEAYLRLVKNKNHQFSSSGHFFVAAAEAMRRILIDRARQKGSKKRGGNGVRVELDPDRLAASQTPTDILALDKAPTKFAGVDSNAAELVKLRYFAGLTLTQAAEALGMPRRSADRLWAYARAWLRTALAEE